MAQGRNFATALLVSAASISMIAAGTTVPAAAQAATGNYRIESQPLGQALMQLSRQANVDIVAPAKITRGRTGKAVAAESVDAALRQMLAGSGLTFKRAGSRYVIQSGSVGGQGGNAAAEPDRAEAPASGSSVVSVPSATASTVVDARTGAALKGALVEIVETGEKTSTGDLGEFRFPSKNGSFNLRVSYLGYPEYQQFVDLKDGRATSGILLSDGSATGEIIVTAYQSARAQALNQERVADNAKTVVSADLLGNFSGTTISESLRRVPGVTFSRNPITGDGINIEVRGLTADLNAVKFNGVELPETTGTGRSASLGNILTESIQEVTIHKTLLPSQDSAGTGGLVEIRTKSPLDRPHRYASAKIEYGQSAAKFNRDFLAAGTISGTFGSNEQFGLSASLQYRKRRIDSFNYQANLLFGQYLPLQVDGSPTIISRDQIDPRTPFPFSPDASDVYSNGLTYAWGSTDGYAVNANLAAAWQVDSGTRLELDYQLLSSKDDQYESRFAYGGGVVYSPRPVVGLGGQTRQILRYTGLFTGLSNYQETENIRDRTHLISLRGESEFGRMHVKGAAGYAIGRKVTPFNNVSASSFIFLSPGDVDSAAMDPVEGRVLTPYGRRMPGDSSIPFPLFAPSGFAQINDPANNYVGSIESYIIKGSSERWNGELSLNYEVGGGVLKDIEIGGSFKSTRLKTDPFASNVYFPYAMPVTFADGGIALDNGQFDRIGVSSPVGTFNPVQMAAFFRMVAGSAEMFDITNPDSCITATFCGDVFAAHPDAYRAFTQEGEFAAYAQSRAEFGKFSIIGGVRFSRYRILSANLQSPSVSFEDGTSDTAFALANTKLVEERATQTTLLPRLLMNYRPRENLVARLGFYQSIARPQISQLSTENRVSLFLQPLFGPNFNQPRLSVSKGNPDLKSARTDNFDLSLEYYDRNIGVIKAGAFFKRIKNLLESNSFSTVAALDGVVLPDDPRFDDVLANPSDYNIIVNQPFNNSKAGKIWGLEFALERRFNFLPGALSGLGIYANYTYANSSKTRIQSFEYSPVLDSANNLIGFETINIVTNDFPFANQSKHSGTAGLTYSKYGIDAALYYTAQSRKLGSPGSHGLNGYEQPFSTLDLRVEYAFHLAGADARLNLQGLNLLKSKSDPVSKVGTSGPDVGTYINQAFYLGGRQLRAGLSIAF